MSIIEPIKWRDYVVVDPSVCHGKACLKGTRIMVSVVLDIPRADELIYGVIGCPAQSSIKNKSYLVEAAKEILDSVMICSEPFAVAYGMDWFTDLLVIDIGAGTVGLCRMHGTLPEEEDQITLSTAGDHVDKELARQIKKSYPDAQYSENMIKTIKERC